jgi:molybdopterin converting factor small subunit
MPTMFIPIDLRKFTDGLDKIDVIGETLREALAALEQHFPGLRDRIVVGDRVRPGLAAVVDGEQTVDGLRSKLREHSEVHFLRPISGGA